MKIELPNLNAVERQHLLRILNTDLESKPEQFLSAQEKRELLAAKKEGKGPEYWAKISPQLREREERTLTRRTHLLERETRRRASRMRGVQLASPGHRGRQALLREWRDTQSVFLRIGVTERESPGFWIKPPMLGLPAKEPRAIIASPVDLANWFAARLLANRKWRALVRCQICLSFAFRQRARAENRYCSAKCQAEANLKQKAERYAGKFPPQIRDKVLEGYLAGRAKSLGILPWALNQQAIRLELRRKAHVKQG